MAGKVGCGLLLAVLFCAAAVSRAPFVVFLLALAVVFTAFLWWDARTLRRQVTAALQLPAKPVRPGGGICRDRAPAKRRAAHRA